MRIRRIILTNILVTRIIKNIIYNNNNDNDIIVNNSPPSRGPPSRRWHADAAFESSALARPSAQGLGCGWSWVDVLPGQSPRLPWTPQQSSNAIFLIRTGFCTLSVRTKNMVYSLQRVCKILSISSMIRNAKSAEPACSPVNPTAKVC